jgi:hypothetical protein
MNVGRLAAVLLCAGGFATAAVAQVPDIFVGAAAGTSEDLFENFIGYQESILPSGTATAQVGALPGPGDTTGIFARAETTFGTNRAQALALNQIELAAAAFSYWTDSFTVVNGPGTGTANVSVTLSGSIQPGLLTTAVYALFVSTAPLNDDEKLLAALGDLILGIPSTDPAVVISHVASNFDTAPIVLTGTYGYTYGTPFYLAGVLGTIAAFNGDVDLFNTAQFGISTLGAIDTGSDTIYAAAVPEPGTWAMMFAGLVLLAFVARRRVRRA